jgi:phospholipase D1/2
MESRPPSLPNRHHTRNAVLVLLSVGFTLGAIWRFTSLHERINLQTLIQWGTHVRGHPWTPIGVAVIFAAGGLLVFMHAILLWTTVFTFDPWHAFLFCELGSLSSALLLYGLGRVLKEEVVKRIAGSYMGELSRAIGRKGIASVFLLHLFPICPFSILNLLSGATHIRFRDFVIGTLVGMTPGLVVLVFFGNRLLKIIEQPRGWDIAFLAAFATAGFFVLRAARRWLLPHDHA